MKQNNILRVAICDDEESALEIVSSATVTAFSGKGIQIILDKFSSLTQVERRLESVTYDLLLLDIKLQNKEDGIAFAHKLRDGGNSTPIVFVSSCEDRVFETFPVKPFGFIRKSHFLKDIVKVIDGFIDGFKRRDPATIIVKSNCKMLNIEIENIIYIESCKREQLLHLVGNQQITCFNSMQEFEEQLAPHGFLRAHKSFIVNYRFISLIRAGNVELNNGKLVPTSRTYEKTLKEEYLRKMRVNGAVIFD